MTGNGRIEVALVSLETELRERAKEANELDAQAAAVRAECQRVKKAIAALKRGGSSAPRQQTLSLENVRSVVELELGKASGAVDLIALQDAVKSFAKERGFSARGAHRVLARAISELGLEEQGGRVEATKPLGNIGDEVAHNEGPGESVSSRNTKEVCDAQRHE